MNRHRHNTQRRQARAHLRLREGVAWVSGCLILCSGVAAAGEQKKAPPARPAVQYAAFETHPAEHVSVAAEPCTAPADCPFFRLPYVEHGFLPVRVVITNDSGAALSLEDARMQFVSAAGDRIPAALPEDIQRRLLLKKTTRIPLPAPLPPITIHHAPVDKKIVDDDADFGFQGTTVEPHSTLAGYLFYDIRGLDDPALKAAEFYVREVHTMDGRTKLFGFTISFEKWLAAHPGGGSMAKEKQDKHDTRDTRYPGHP